MDVAGEWPHGAHWPGQTRCTSRNRRNARSCSEKRIRWTGCSRRGRRTAGRRSRRRRSPGTRRSPAKAGAVRGAPTPGADTSLLPDPPPSGQGLPAPTSRPTALPKTPRELHTVAVQPGSGSLGLSLFISLFCSLGSTYEWDNMAFVFLWVGPSRHFLSGLVFRERT